MRIEKGHTARPIFTINILVYITTHNAWKWIKGESVDIETMPQAMWTGMICQSLLCYLPQSLCRIFFPKLWYRYNVSFSFLPYRYY